MALELLRLAQQQGPATWVCPTLAGRPFQMPGPVTPCKEWLPASGSLRLAFKAATCSSRQSVALTPAEFLLLWSRLVAQRGEESKAASRRRAGAQQAGLAGDAAGGPRAGSGAVDRGGSAAAGGGHQPPKRGLSYMQLKRTMLRAASKGAADMLQAVAAAQAAAAATTAPESSPAASASPPASSRPCQYVDSILGKHCSGDAAGADAPSSPSSHCPSSSSSTSSTGSGSSATRSRSDAPQRVLSEKWKLGLLGVLAADYYLSSAQARAVVADFAYGQDRVEAAVQVFGCVMDPEFFCAQVYQVGRAWHAHFASSTSTACMHAFTALYSPSWPPVLADGGPGVPGGRVGVGENGMGFGHTAAVYFLIHRMHACSSSLAFHPAAACHLSVLSICTSSSWQPHQPRLSPS